MKTNLFSRLCRYSPMALLFLCLIISYGCTGAARSAACSPVEAKLGVLIIHGVGSQKEDFADSMIKKLEGEISDPAKVCWQTVYWDPILYRKEDDLLRKLFPEGESLRGFELRKLVMNYIGDLAAYRDILVTSSQTNETYDKIHERVHEAIVKLRGKLGNADKPVIAMAHSLGSVIMFEYIWNRQNWDGQKEPDGDSDKKQDEDPYGKTPFERMETLAGFVTFGSPYALFTLADDPVLSINFTPDKKAKWLNFYDTDDVLGWPLKDLPVCSVCAVEDKPINVGGIFRSWNPLCHSKYWTDNDFTKPVAKYISDILKLYP